MEEIWKPVLGFEEIFEVNNYGIFKVKEFTIIYSNGYKHKHKEHIIEPKLKNRYLYITTKVKRKSFSKSLHTIVWRAFNGEIPKGYDVHHINHNTFDNRLENLCLVEKKKHCKMHNPKGVPNTKLSRAVIQYTLDGVFVKEYPSASQAARENEFSQGNISMCCRGECKSRYGYIWKYKEVA